MVARDDADAIRKLGHLQQIKNSRAKSELARLKSEENEIRAHLERLQQQKKDIWAADKTLTNMRITGMDLHWYSWVETSHREVLIRLARLKSQMERMIRIGATEQAREDVLSKLEEGAADIAKTSRNHVALDEILALSVIARANQIRQDTSGQNAPGKQSE